VNGIQQIQGINYTESLAPVVQWSTIRMVNTLAAMHNLKEKKIDFTQPFHKQNSKTQIPLMVSWASISLTKTTVSFT
jgi:hypothetical protein